MLTSEVHSYDCEQGHTSERSLELLVVGTLSRVITALKNLVATSMNC